MTFQCKYCHKVYVQEENFQKHRCEHMVRDELLKTPLGQTAWMFYQEWRRYRKQLVPDKEVFMRSRFFNAFVRFADFVRRTQLPKPNMYVQIVTNRNISPLLWIDNTLYLSYLEHIDQNEPPVEQAKQTIKTIINQSENLGCCESDFFNAAHPQDILHLIQSRQLSPWILLLSPQFKHFLRNRTTIDQQLIIQAIIKPPHWAERFRKNPKIVSIMRKFVQEMGI